VAHGTADGTRSDPSSSTSWSGGSVEYQSNVVVSRRDQFSWRKGTACPHPWSERARPAWDFRSGLCGGRDRLEVTLGGVHEGACREIAQELVPDVFRIALDLRDDVAHPREDRGLLVLVHVALQELEDVQSV